MKASCHRGAVVLDIAEAPNEITDCNRSNLRRYGAFWACYERKQVEVWAGEGTHSYLWGHRPIAFHRCRTCGWVSIRRRSIPRAIAWAETLG